jgi:hypothetical protein
MKKTINALFKKSTEYTGATERLIAIGGEEYKPPVIPFVTSKMEVIVLGEKETIIPKDSEGFKITLKHIALRAHYEGKIISESNASEFLKGTGLKSGKKLSQYYSFYNNSTDRRANPESKIKLKNKIKLFEEVATLLPKNLRTKAIDEKKHLESFISCY